MNVTVRTEAVTTSVRIAAVQRYLATSIPNLGAKAAEDLARSMATRVLCGATPTDPRLAAYGAVQHRRYVERADMPLLRLPPGVDSHILATGMGRAWEGA